MATTFEFEFTLEQLTLILSNNQQVDGWFNALSDILPKFEITTTNRVSMFLAQTAHESANYTILHENLNYKPESLVKVWPTRFNAATAAQYGRKPEMIANKVYANRMGNGDESSGDGWKFRGRGILQITGKENYRSCSNFLYGDDRLLSTPELLEEDMAVAVSSACWFWNSRNLNTLSDVGDIKEVTRKINGGFIGLEDRVDRFNKANVIFRRVDV